MKFTYFDSLDPEFESSYWYMRVYLRLLKEYKLNNQFFMANKFIHLLSIQEQEDIVAGLKLIDKKDRVRKIEFNTGSSNSVFPL